MLAIFDELANALGCVAASRQFMADFHWVVEEAHLEVVHKGLGRANIASEARGRAEAGVGAFCSSCGCGSCIDVIDVMDVIDVIDDCW